MAYERIVYYQEIMVSPIYITSRLSQLNHSEPLEREIDQNFVSASIIRQVCVVCIGAIIG